MSDYRRAWVAGGCHFFTVVTQNRQPWLATPAAVTRLRRAFVTVMRKRPFTIDAIVVLPDHLHAIWRLPADDEDFATRWRLIKHFMAVNGGGRWQPRYWEHLIRDEDDWRRHVDYIHYNPVKHGHASAPADWPYSSFQRAVRRGWHEITWGAQSPPRDIAAAGE